MYKRQHINRAIITERAALGPLDEVVNVVPQLHAGGSFTVTVYNNAKEMCIRDSLLFITVMRKMLMRE